MFIENFQYYTFSCLKSNLEDVRDFLKSNNDRLKKYEIESLTSFNFDLYDDRPKKGGAHLKKSYFFKPLINDEYIVFVSNSADGWETLVNYISSGMKIDSFSFIISNANDSNFLNSFVFRKEGGEIRRVYVIKDEKWIFHAEGDVQWFEDEKNYHLRSIKQRMNRDVILEYCQKLDFRISDDSFWKSNSSFSFVQVS